MFLLEHSLSELCSKPCSVGTPPEQKEGLPVVSWSFAHWKAEEDGEEKGWAASSDEEKKIGQASRGAFHPT